MHWPGGKSWAQPGLPGGAGGPSIGYRREAVTPQGGEARAAHARQLRTGHATPAAYIKEQPLVDDRAHAAGRLHVGPVPLARPLRNRNEWLSPLARPVKAVPAEGHANIVRLLTLAQLASEHGEQAKQHAFIGDGVEVVQLPRGRRHLRPRAIGAIGAHPTWRPAGRPGGGAEVARFEIAA